MNGSRTRSSSSTSGRGSARKPSSQLLVVVVVLSTSASPTRATSSTCSSTGGAAGWLLCLQVIILVIMGSSQVSASVNGARASGILDFHRVSPHDAHRADPRLLLRRPIREYLLFAATLPFTLLCMAFGVPSLRGFVQLMILLITTGLVASTAGRLLNGLISKSKDRYRQRDRRGCYLDLLLFINVIMSGRWFSINLAEGEQRLSFYGLSLPWLPVILLYQLPFLFFILLACCRKMESARLHPLSKPQSIVAMVTFAALVLGGIWRQEDYEYLRDRGPVSAGDPGDPAHDDDHP